MDQLYPMMYFSGNNFYPFAIDWQEHNYGRTIVAGLGTYMLHRDEGNWPLAEVKRQLNVTRQLGQGHCHFRAKFLLDNVKGIYDLMAQHDRQPALIPPVTWAQSLEPTAPTLLSVERTTEGDNIEWSGAIDRSDGPYLLYNIYASSEAPVDIRRPENLIATRWQTTRLSVKRKSGKPWLHYAVTALDRYGNESLPIRSTEEKTATGNDNAAEERRPLADSSPAHLFRRAPVGGLRLEGTHSANLRQPRAYQHQPVTGGHVSAPFAA
jgi:hypothetical protein